MQDNQLPDEIRKVAADLDKAIEDKNTELILSSFSDDCEIELLGTKLTGKKGARKFVNWMYEHLSEVTFVPITILVDGNAFFEEFILKGKLHNGIEVQSKQAEVLIYENYKVKSLRLYFDRLEFADSVAKGPVSKTLVRKLIKRSLKGLV
jgi:ketosteroid isomerase-like protein